MHGWRWPYGTEATVARCLGVSQFRVQMRRLELLLNAVKGGSVMGIAMGHPD